MSDTKPCPDSSNSKKSDAKVKILWLGFPVILLIWVAYYYFESPLDKDDPFDRLNTLFSGLAFGGLVFAILLQKSELALQRNELELTRREVRGQKEQLEAQNRTLRQQRFENTFFSLLNLFNSIVNSIEIKRSRMIGETPNTLASGRECFATFSLEFGHKYSVQRKEHSDWGGREVCVTAYEEFSGVRQVLVGHYFRTLGF